MVQLEQKHNGYDEYSRGERCIIDDFFFKTSRNIKNLPSIIPSVRMPKLNSSDFEMSLFLFIS